QVYLGGPTLPQTPTYTIQRVGPTQVGGQPLKVSLTATAGDFNGDGKADLAVLEYTAQNAPIVAVTGAPANGQLSGDAHFTFTVGSYAPASVTVPRNTGTASVNDLVNNINVALANAPLNSSVVAGAYGNTLTFSSPVPLKINIAAGAPAATDMGFRDGQ